MLHFAYGSNMDRAAMARRCPTAVVLGPARLDHWRYGIMRAGYASAQPAPGDLAAVNAYESIDSGLYRRHMLTVIHDGRRVQALVYIAGERAAGRPQPGYQELVVRAACDWDLPDPYIRALAHWLPRRARASARSEVA